MRELSPQATEGEKKFGFLLAFSRKLHIHDRFSPSVSFAAKMVWYRKSKEKRWDL
jgi:hypothetical protein